MEVRFAPVLPVQPARAPVETRARGPQPEQTAPFVARGRDVPAVPADRAEGRAAQAGDNRDATSSARQPARLDFPRARIQPELPPVTRNALEVFVRNSFSEEEDPARRLGGIDLFV